MLKARDAANPEAMSLGDQVLGLADAKRLLKKSGSGSAKELPPASSGRPIPRVTAADVGRFMERNELFVAFNKP